MPHLSTKLCSSSHITLRKSRRPRAARKPPLTPSPWFHLAHSSGAHAVSRTRQARSCQPFTPSSVCARRPHHFLRSVLSRCWFASPCFTFLPRAVTIWRTISLFVYRHSSSPGCQPRREGCCLLCSWLGLQHLEQVEGPRSALGSAFYVNEWANGYSNTHKYAV